jgi:hypothetical protein
MMPAARRAAASESAPHRLLRLVILAILSPILGYMVDCVLAGLVNGSTYILKGAVDDLHVIPSPRSHCRALVGVTFDNGLRSMMCVEWSGFGAARIAPQTLSEGERVVAVVKRNWFGDTLQKISTD